MPNNTTNSCPDCSIAQKEIESLRTKLFSNQAIDRFGTFGFQIINELVQKIKMKDDIIRALQASLIKLETEKLMLQAKLKNIGSTDEEIAELDKDLKALTIEAVEEETEAEEASDI